MAVLEPEAGNRFFTDLAKSRVRRISVCPRAGCVDHPHRAVAVNTRHDADVSPVLAGIDVGAEEEDQIARFGTAGAETSADGGVVLQLVLRGRPMPTELKIVWTKQLQSIPLREHPPNT